jgi:hypothetical protein
VRWIPESARWRILVFGAASAAVALYPGGLARPIARATLHRHPFVKGDGTCTAGRLVMAVLAGRFPMLRVRSA